MIHRAFAFFVTGLFCLGIFAGQALAQDAAEREDEIRTLLEARDAEIKSTLGDAQAGNLSAQQRATLKTLVNGVIDFRAMGQAALGPYWKDLSADQKNEFIEVFSDIVREQSLANLEPYRAEVTYKNIDVTDDNAYVTTTTVYDGEPITVEYAMHYADGEWRATDIIIDQVSTVGGYERSFQTVIRKKGFDALMTSLRKKRQKIMS